MTTAIVSGSRSGSPTVHHLARLAYLIGYHEVDRLLVGCCTGVDRAVARYFHQTPNFPIHGYPAYYSQLEWARWAYDEGVLSTYVYPREVEKATRKLAGPRRNALMAKEAGEGGILFAFPGGRGTESMKTQARKAGLRVLVWMESEERFAEEVQNGL